MDESTYRADEALSYSTLSTYERGNQFDSLKTLFDRKESPSLVFGSCVDALITGGQEEFGDNFLVVDLPTLPPSLINICNDLFNVYGGSCKNLSEINTQILANTWDKYDGRNWKDTTKANFIIDNGSEYYRLKFIAGTKTIISNELYTEVLATVRALKESKATKWYFETDNPFNKDIERLYQLKFKATIDGVNYRGMLDEVIVNHKNKTILPIDLKTSSKSEYNFYKSFIEWGYMWQAKLYTKLLKENISKDDYFKDFTILPYIFIVANRKTLTPLVWEFTESLNTNDFICGKDNRLIYRSPLSIGKELHNYLSSRPKVPNGINIDKPNNLIKWLNKI